MADRRQAALVVVHHTSKSPRADPVDEISGTLGLTGAFDTILVLKRERQQNEATLILTGRDVDEQEVALTIDLTNQVWRNHGSAAQHRISKERHELLQLLTRHAALGLRPREIADLLGKGQGAVRGLLFKMVDHSQVTIAEGRYFPGPAVATVNAINDGERPRRPAPQDRLDSAKGLGDEAPSR